MHELPFPLQDKMFPVFMDTVQMQITNHEGLKRFFTLLHVFTTRIEGHPGPKGLHDSSQCYCSPK